MWQQNGHYFPLKIPVEIQPENLIQKPSSDKDIYAVKGIHTELEK